MLATIIAATILISAMSLVAVLLLGLKEKLLEKLVPFFVALAAGTMLGAAFLHLIPESAEVISLESTFLLVLSAFVGFFVLEKVIHWHHCHISGKHNHKQALGSLNLVGDALHNFIDGLVLAGAFVADFRLGVITAVAIILHEIPQEIGDFGVLIYSGWKKSKAVMANVLVASTMIIGGIAGYFLSSSVDGMVAYLTAFAAGGFIYVSASDLMPELREEQSLKKSFGYLLVFLVGILIMFFIRD